MARSSGRSGTVVEDAIALNSIPLTTMETKLGHDSSGERSSKADIPPGSDNIESEEGSLLRAIMVITILSGVSFLNTMGSGILTVALPQMSKDLDLQESLILWPASVYALAAGCTLLIFGSLADVIGPKRIWQTGSGLYAVFTLGCGLSRTGIQLITFRILLGMSIAMCLPSAMSLTTKAFKPGGRRNICFACTGMGQPLGYSLGLILGGVFTDTIGWRYGYYISAIINVILFGAAFKGLPVSKSEGSGKEVMRRIVTNIDWTGAGLLSVSMGLLSYVLA